MQISILTIGNELLNGSTLNTNASWIGKSLTQLGCQIQKHITVKDDKAEIKNGLDTLLFNNPDSIIVTGGLGPTNDDITRDVVFEFVGVKKKIDKKYWLELTKYFKRLGYDIPPINKNQACIPSRGEIIPNPRGSARGYNFSYSNSNIIVLPGVPLEMKIMMKESIIPSIRSSIKQKYFSKTIKTTGLSESLVATYINKKVLMNNSCSIGYYPSLYGVDLTISGNQLKKVQNLSKEIESILKNNIYSNDNTTLERVIVEIARGLDKTIAVAESCTGGLIGSRITEVEGSSAVFKGGVIAYSNESKINILGVKRNTLKSFGAVSDQVASEMAYQVRKRFSVNYGLSITGIAGPDGGTKSKPVGLVYIGLSSQYRTVVKKFNFSNSRNQIRIRTSQAGLNFLRMELING